MARARRRSTRTNLQKSPELSPLSTRSNTPRPTGLTETEPSHSEEDTCPACTAASIQAFDAFDKENWIMCDVCKTWYHWRCAGNGGDVDIIDKWYCASCLQAEPTRTITLKPPARKSSRKRLQRDYANLNSGVDSDPNRWLRMLEGKVIKDDNVRRMKGEEVSLEWLEEDEGAMQEPIVIESQEGLGMKMPPNDFSVNDVARLVGEDAPVEVIDVASQSASPGWTLRRWVDYFNLEPSAREKIWNVISLEVSDTKLADQILPPRLVRELDWVQNFWPAARKGKGQVYPKVQLYCLMGVATAWTDWHVDFAGSSVYYHIIHGSKVFYFIRPTPANLNAYERWSGTDIQNHAWLGDMVDEVFKVVLTEGNTMIIPTGWIHAVYTPIDTLVFGGNFLHSYGIPTQLKVRNIEIATHVPKKFRFPMFTKLCWYVGEKYLRGLKAREEYPSRVLQSLEALAEFLVSEARIMERGPDQAKKEARDQVPSDRVKDASATARELRWRVRIAAGHASDDEASGHQREKDVLNGPGNGVGSKRKRITSDSLSVDEESPRFRNFKPRLWDSITEKAEESEKRVLRARKPSDDWKDHWVEWRDNVEASGDAVNVNSQRYAVVKVRRTARGIERQRVERVVEEWIWGAEGGPS